MVLHVNDKGFAAPNRKNVKDFVEELEQEGYDLEIEGDFTKYLGIRIEEQDDGARHMSHVTEGIDYKNHQNYQFD